ncbi:MAG: DUF1385 domain-containing protein [Bacillota bacterium]|nr:DUF1385 domain-containing protein [Bacillota bacterium]
MKKPFYYGGQAVIEGVMMMGPKEYAVSVRKENGEIVTKKEPVDTIKNKYPILKWPIIRGFVNLIEMLILGMKNITWSANQSGEEDEELGFWGMLLAIALAVVVVVGLFIAAPVFVGTWIHPVLGDFGRSLVEGILRIGAFILYIVLIRRMEEIRRVFQYHGAEHKSIAAYENGDELTPEAAAKYTTLHMRCGTAFMLMVMIVMIIVFTFVGQTESSWARILIKLVSMPFIAGLTYEVTRFCAGHCQYKIVRILMAPGLWMQKLTTEEPDLSQLEVALTSLKAVIPGYYREHPEELPEKISDSEKTEEMKI